MSEDLLYINYWKEIQKEKSEILKNLKGIVLLAHNSIEFTDILDILNKIRPDQHSYILYVSFTRSYDFMKIILNKRKIANKKIFFIDCVSSYAVTPEKKPDDCMYHKPVQNLSETKEIINLGIEKIHPNIVVIDSFSQHINFSRPTDHELNDFYRFLQVLKTDSLDFVLKTIILLYDSKMSAMWNLPKISLDLILKIEILKEIPRWKD